jgi:hypothetical protein
MFYNERTHGERAGTTIVRMRYWWQHENVASWPACILAKMTHPAANRFPAHH